MTEDHAIEVDDMTKGFANEKTIMKSDFEEQICRLKVVHSE